MENNKANNTIITRAAAAAMGITMAFGGIAVPVMQNSQFTGSIIRAYAQEQNIPDAVYGWNFGTFKYGGHTFEYAYKAVSETEVGNGSNEAFVLINVKMGERTLSIPKTVTIDGVTHTVNALCSSFGTGIKAESVLIPDTITDIGNYVFMNASISRLTIEGGVKNIGSDFCSGVKDLRPQFINIDTSSLEELGRNAFSYTDLHTANSKGAVVVNGCLLEYTVPDITELKVQELSDEPITCIANDCFKGKGIKTLKTLDITGVRTLSPDALNDLSALTELKGTDDLRHYDLYSLADSSWGAAQANATLIILGDHLCRYIPTDNEIDLTTDKFKNVTVAERNAFRCKQLRNLTTLKLRENEPLLTDSFADMPQTLQVLENVYIGGKKVECTSYDQFVPELIQDHYKNVFSYSKFSRDFANQKIKLIFDELGIEYYGTYNDKTGTLSAEKEYDISKKLFDLLSKEYHIKEGGTDDLFEMLNTGAPAGSSRVFSELYAYMLLSAGVDTDLVTADEAAVEHYIRFDDNEAAKTAAKIAGNEDDSYTWNVVRIGGNWYHTDISRSSLICDMNKSGTTNYGAFMFNDTSWDMHEEQTDRSDRNRYDFLQSDRYTYSFSYQSKRSYQNGKSTYYADAIYMPEDENGIIPYYGDVNNDYIREDTDDKLLQGLLLVPKDIKAKIIAGEELTDEEISSLGNIKVAGNTESDPINMANADGSPAFDIKQCDLNFDGEYDMLDVLLSQQLHSFMSRSPLKGMNNNTYVPKADNSSEETAYNNKMSLFDRFNSEACIGEAFYSSEQYTFTDFTDLVTRLNRPENMFQPTPMPAPAPAKQKEPESIPSSDTGSSSRTETEHEDSRAANDTGSSSKKETVDSKASDETENDSKTDVNNTENNKEKDTETKDTDNTKIPDTAKPAEDEPADTADDIPADSETTDAEDTEVTVTVIKGDLNGDNEINVTDIALTASHIKGIKAIDADRLEAADIDGNGVIDVSDIAMIAAHIKGIKALK